MSETDARFAELSPERRELIQRLLKSRPVAAIPSSSEPAAKPACGRNHASMEFFDSVNNQLEQSGFGEFSYFLNFGYVANQNPQRAVVRLPEQSVNRNSAKLTLEVIGDCALDGKRVLDIGCGRGGTASVVNEFFRPRSFLGLDLSGKAIAFCRRTHRYAGFAFVQGDAERLPFPNGAADVVTNLESSQSYSDIRAFYCEVYRVLAPGGCFLYTDVRPVRQMMEWLGLLATIGFRLEADRDITSNVLLSCDEVACQREKAYAATRDDKLLKTFLGAPGSPVYEEMKNGSWLYRIFRLRK